jgi:cell fate (sporulation/competence/biofilm development) regulator YlbF (YheA/YmcA/DUF963 family)
MDRSKAELLGTIQSLNQRAKQQSADLKGQREALKDIDDDLPAKKELVDLSKQGEAAKERLKTQREKSEDYRDQNKVVLEAKADLETTLDSLSETLLHYVLKTKQKSVHADPNDPAEVDREIVTVAKLGMKVPANLSLFEEDNS